MIVQGLAKQAGNERFAWDAYRRLPRCFADVSASMASTSSTPSKLQAGQGRQQRPRADAADLQHLVETFKGIVKAQAGREFPQDPREQMTLAINAVFGSWNSDRAILYRRQERIPRFGHGRERGRDGLRQPGHGLGHRGGVHRDPGTGAQGVYGDYLQNAQGEDVVAGIRNTVPLQDLENINKAPTTS